MRRIRYDQNETIEFRLDDLKSPESGPGGSVFVSGIVARPGIYEYRNPDGSIRRELVPEDMLWKEDSIGTLGGCPVTIEHPPEMITSENVTQYLHGDVSPLSIKRAKGGFVQIDMTVRTDAALSALDGGKVQLSPGYEVGLLEEPGEHPVFGHYDAIQTHRDYNHVAIVDAARGGEQMAVRIDSANGDEVLVSVPRADMKEVSVHTSTTVEEYEDKDGVVTSKSTTVHTTERTADYNDEADKGAEVPEPALAIVQHVDAKAAVCDSCGQKIPRKDAQDETDDAPLTLAAAEAMFAQLRGDLGEQLAPIVESLSKAPAAEPAPEPAPAEEPPAEEPPAEEPPAEEPPAEEPPAEEPAKPPVKKMDSVTRLDAADRLSRDPGALFQVRKHFDSLARDLQIDYGSDDGIGAVARQIVSAARPDLTDAFSTDDEFIAAARVLQLKTDSEDAVFSRRDSNSASPASTVTTPYGPSNA